MPTEVIFDDGAAYERYMGVWSQSAGRKFLDWLRPAPALRWLDVGCGNGAFTELIARRCQPALLAGVDPSGAQLRHARSRPELAAARFEQGDAMALPFADAGFDVAVMPLVLFFVPDPARGVAEMKRVLAPDGIASAYSWDMTGGGFPYRFVHEEMEAMGVEVARPPSPEASRMEAVTALWAGAGLRDIATTPIRVERTYPGFEEYWRIAAAGPSAGKQIAAMSPADQERLQQRLRGRIGATGNEPFTLSAVANAIQGRK